MLNRRHFLSTASVLGLAAAGGSAVRAFQLQDATPEQSSLYLSAACRQDTFHDQVIQELEAAMSGRQLTDAEKQEIKRTLSCPFCGCSYASL